LNAKFRCPYPRQFMKLYHIMSRQTLHEHPDYWTLLRSWASSVIEPDIPGRLMFTFPLHLFVHFVQTRNATDVDFYKFRAIINKRARLVRVLSPVNLVYTPVYCLYFNLKIFPTASKSS
jgi:hypothetical protein